MKNNSLILLSCLFAFSCSHLGHNLEKLEAEIKIQDGETLLIWNTKQELNTDCFLIECAEDGNNFNMVGKIDALGQSLFGQSYALELVGEPKPSCQYRVVMVNSDGSQNVAMVSCANLFTVDTINR